jgi:hypothetical protein
MGVAFGIKRLLLFNSEGEGITTFEADERFIFIIQLGWPPVIIYQYSKRNFV